MITLDGSLGITTPGLTNTGTETIVNLTTTGNTILGNASTDTLNVGNGSIVTDGAGNTGFNGTATNYGATYRGIWLNAPAVPIMDFAVNGTRTLSVLATSTTPTIKTVTNTPLIFGTNDTERMRIEAAGTLTVTGAITSNSQAVVTNITVASVPVGTTQISTNLTTSIGTAAGGWLIYATMGRGGASVADTYSAVYLYSATEAAYTPTLRTILASDAPGNNNGNIAISGTTVVVGWGGSRGPAAVTAIKLW